MKTIERIETVVFDTPEEFGAEAVRRFKVGEAMPRTSAVVVGGVVAVTAVFIFTAPADAPKP